MLLMTGTKQQSQQNRIEVSKQLKKAACYSFKAVLLGSPLSTTNSDSALEKYKEPNKPNKKKRDDPDDDETQSLSTFKLTRANSRKQQTLSSANLDSSTGHGSKYQGKKRVSSDHFCTQKCLLGLIRGQQLDLGYPNIRFVNTTGLYHRIGPLDFPKLLRDQLADPDSLDDNCKLLGLYGATGHLFRVTLASYSSVVVAKGSIRLSPLRYKGKMYKHINSLQGNAIPVPLGNISLVHPDYLD